VQQKLENCAKVYQLCKSFTVVPEFNNRAMVCQLCKNSSLKVVQKFVNFAKFSNRAKKVFDDCG